MVETVPVDAKSADSNSVELEKQESKTIEFRDDRKFDLQQIKVNERKVLAKIDLRVVPVLCVLSLLAFLDRYVAQLRKLLPSRFLTDGEQCQYRQCGTVWFEAGFETWW